MAILVVHAYLPLSMDINRYAWTTLLSISISIGYPWISSFYPWISISYPWILGLGLDIQGNPWISKISMDIQYIQHSHAILVLKENLFQQPNFVGN